MRWRGIERRVFAYGEAVDFRQGSRGLLGVTKSELGEEVLSGDVFVFINRRRNLLRLLWWDRTGWCLLGKRLERRKFELQRKDKKQELSNEELELLLDGILSSIV